MKTTSILLATLAMSLSCHLHAQGGSLTPPPGPPAPVMRTLTEIYDKAAAVETRIAVNSLAGDADSLHQISQSGSYYLTGNITGVASKHGIKITAPNVTLDLNGYTLTGANTFLNGIHSTSANITVRNGKLTGWSAANMAAINLTGVEPHVEDIHISSSYSGIHVNASGAQVHRCHVTGLTGKFGILSTAPASLVSDCVVRGITTSAASMINGIQAATVSRCHVSEVESSAGPVYGIMADNSTDSHVSALNSSGSNVCYIFSKNTTGCRVEQVSLPSSAASETTGIIGSIVSNCTIAKLQTNSPGGAVGIKACRVTNCIVQSISNTAGSPNVIGIAGNVVSVSPVGAGGADLIHVADCTVSGIAGIGIRASGTCLIENNIVQYCTGASAYAIYAVASGIVRSNTTSNSTTGIYLSRGSATANVSISDTTAFSFGASCRYGPIVTGGGAGGFDATSNFDQ